MISRLQADCIEKLSSKFPVICVTGIRQCGKTTLLKNSFPKYKYVSLEDPDIREYAVNDPRGFLKIYNSGCIIDEAQQAPELFSYIQTKVDEVQEMGSYILSGSHNFLLMQSISQSLAGRAAILQLAPLSINELKSSDMPADPIYEMMYKGFYPALYSRNISPEEYFPSYVQTYIERDVRLIRNIPNANNFIKFIRILAARTGQILSYTELSNASGISVPTARQWLSVLEQSYIVFFLQPYYNNYSKRLVKSPKLYFYDVGLLCYLLGIESAEQLADSNHRGAIFETMVVSEYIKSKIFIGREPMGFFWRDSNQNEIDLLTENKGKLKAYEIKLSSTANKKHLATLQKFAKIADLSPSDITCIYTGESDINADYGNFVRFDRVFYKN